MDNSYLILSRKAGESITLQVPDSNGSTIGIHIDVLEQRNKIGIEAPREVIILRHELISKVDQIRPENTGLTSSTM